MILKEFKTISDETKIPFFGKVIKSNKSFWGEFKVLINK
jgi:hypothetical protein